ncbi:helix-turn-helix domain-containing protein [Coraliomargarita akajimensis]|uniref:helix-turn-helix domain-containing protein n=1 Tax=Coraliomargarita akajimensis TaxID=395922 RepID=UPI003CCD8D7A
MALKTLREEQGLTQVALAEACRCDVSSISKLERGLTQPSLHFMLVLAKGLEVEPLLLLKQTLAQHPEI